MPCRIGTPQRSHKGATTASRIPWQGRAASPRDRREHTLRAFAGAVLIDGIAAQTRPTKTGDDDVSGFNAALHSIHHPRSARLAPDSATSDRARRRQPAVVVGYALVGAEQPHRASPELRRQQEEIASVCELRGLRLLEVVRERERRGQRALERPALGYALERIAAGQANGLVVSELYRLSHSLPELGRVLDWLHRHDARLVTAVPAIDTNEEAGRLAVRTIIEVSRWERQRLVERTKLGMRAAGRKGPGSVADYPELRERIAGMRAAGLTLQAIADQLNAEGLPTIRGGAKWRPSSVQAAAGYQRPPARRRLDPQPRQTDRRDVSAGEA
jgi:DNA invertase Pin-like site-specific DNA recombinase